MRRLKPGVLPDSSLCLVMAGFRLISRPLGAARFENPRYSEVVEPPGIRPLDPKLADSSRSTPAHQVVSFVIRPLGRSQGGPETPCRSMLWDTLV